ncbi:GMC oxidoreductase [Calocera cornea HHB12733]|uniref:GMC oxidoreductase n=1 Tax=Calocera cornea HHB12733 TaxID=1353952 RepID=A0A165J8C2_9BASI|nr:GMC oxidoreductase [Calocera cornea HHB12733]
MSPPTTMPKLASIVDVADQSFDYIICGGGTAGLTLAARLSSQPSLSILVLEAGPAHLSDPLILDTQSNGSELRGNPAYDWAFKTAPQKHCGGREFLWSRGKTLGGTSAINALIYMRPPAEDVDAWEELGNKGWNWTNHFKYANRSESHDAEGIVSGPYESKMPLDGPMVEAFNKFGIRALTHPFDGNINGTWLTEGSQDPKTKKRSYATTAFFLPNAHRPNLTVLTGVTASKLIFADQVSEGTAITAAGVEILYEGKSYYVEAAKEIILSAGALKSPQLLELSGIGSPDILGPLGIACKVDLPGVGANLQEHMFFGMFFELDENKGKNTADGSNPKEVETVFPMGFARFAFAPLQRISPAAGTLIVELEKRLEAEQEDGKISTSLWDQYQIQLRLLKDENVTDAEIMITPMALPHYSRVPGKSYLTMLAGLNHPFSRGSIHINSTDPEAPPSMDPRYFEEEFDLQFMVEQAKFIRKLSNTEPYKSFIDKEIIPGPDARTDDDLKEYIKRGMSSTWHTAGTCSMLPREKDGVVDAQLKVYGTTNVRIVDLSIIPLHVASHTQSTAYAIAEQAADIILGLA